MAAEVVFARRRQLSEEVAAFLRQSILSGDLAPGASVKAEPIGESLGVSATPVREALQGLRVEGFLDLVPRKGFTVASLTGTDIRDIFEAYALIAGELAARTAARLSDDDLARLRHSHDELLTAVANHERDEFAKANNEFHDLLYEFAGSERLRWALGGFVKYVPRSFYSEVEGWTERSIRDHTAILAAVTSRNPEAARLATSDHIRAAGDELALAFEGRVK